MNFFTGSDLKCFWPSICTEFVDKRESIVKLKEMLKYAEPFAVNGDMDLESLVGKSKFFKVAVLLGARSRDGKFGFKNFPY